MFRAGVRRSNGARGAANTVILVTLRNAGSGVYLWHPKRVSPTQFQVRLNRPATTTYFSWLVVG